MSRKHFSWLLGATILLGIVVFLLPGGTSKQSEMVKQTLLPGLADRINEVDRVDVIGAGNTVIATLQRHEEGWVVDEFGGYTADWAKLRELLAKLARAEIIEPKTANPDYFSRLGVSDVGNEDSEATLLRLQGGGDEVAVLVGNAADGRDGQYVRLLDGDRALLVDQTLQLPASGKDWLQRDIVNIADTEVVEVSVTHPDGSQIRATKVSADDTDFTLQDIPEGREVLSTWSVNSLANALASLQLDSVARADSVDFSQATKFSLLTADGLEVLAEVAEVPDVAGGEDAAESTTTASKTWLRLSAQAHATQEENATGTATEAEHTAESAAGGQESTESTEFTESADTAQAVAAEDAAAEPEETPADAGQRAAEINQRVSGWAYEIPSYKASSMTKRMDDLLKALPDPE